MKELKEEKLFITAVIEHKQEITNLRPRGVQKMIILAETIFVDAKRGISLIQHYTHISNKSMEELLLLALTLLSYTLEEVEVDLESSRRSTKTSQELTLVMTLTKALETMGTFLIQTT
jgi:hypothetical protein